MRRRVAAGLLATLGAGCGNPPAPVSTGLAQKPAMLHSPLPRPHPTLAPPSADALALWKQTRDAPRTTPLQASVVVTRFTTGGGVRMISRYEIIEGKGGKKFRLTYHAPTEAVGRVVVSDGQTVWQYEPEYNVVLRRPASAVAKIPSADVPLPEETAPEEASRPEIEPHTDSVAGRMVQVLVLRAPRSGKIVERRWIDTRTRRTLRTERYDENGKIVRRVEMTQVRFADAAHPARTFRPDFPRSARMVAVLPSHPPNRQTAEAVARRVRLPLRAHRFVLRSLVSSGEDPDNTTQHLLYSDGTWAVSVFVTPGDKEAVSTSARLQAEPGWKTAPLNGKKNGGFMQEKQGRAAVVWTNAGGDRYVAVAQMSLGDLLPVADVLASAENTTPKK